MAAPSALIELAVAAAISLFGFKSGAALSTVVGVLVEGPGDVVGSVDRQRQPRLVRARWSRPA